MTEAEQVFDLINEQAFSGKLERPPIACYFAQSTGSNKDSDGMTFALKFSDGRLMVEKVVIYALNHNTFTDLLDTMAHEMVHVWQVQRLQQFKMDHGKKFKKKLDKVWEKLLELPYILEMVENDLERG